jgi:hypothetical protein
MPSISIVAVREQYPGKTDAEVAAELAEKGEYVVIVRYKLKPYGPFTSFGLCWTYAEAGDYLLNQNLHDVEVLYDRRNTAQIFPKVLHNPEAIKRNIILKRWPCLRALLLELPAFHNYPFQQLFMLQGANGSGSCGGRKNRLV